MHQTFANRIFLNGVAALAMLAAPARGGEIVELEVSEDDGVYTVTLEMRLAAEPDRVFERLTDYAHLDRINPMIRESRIERTLDARTHRVHSVLDGCAGPFCRTMVQVQRVEQHPEEHRIVAHILPGPSDFRAGRSTWDLERTPRGTRLSYQATLAPDVWVPPVVGPWLVKRTLRRELLATVDNLEQLSNEDDVP